MKALFNCTNTILDIAGFAANYGMLANTLLNANEDMLPLKTAVANKIAGGAQLAAHYGGAAAAAFIGNLNWENLSNKIEPNLGSLCKSGIPGLLENTLLGTHISLAIPAALLWKADAVEEIGKAFFTSKEFIVSALTIGALDLLHISTDISTDVEPAAEL